MRVLLLVLLCCVGIHAQGEQRAEANYDRFKDQTSVVVTPRLVGPTGRPSILRVKLGAVFSYDGKQLKAAPKTILIIAVVTSEGWVFVSDRRPPVNILVDGKRAFQGVAIRAETDVVGPYTIEEMAADIPLASFTDITKGRVVEMQIGTLTFQLTPENVADLRELAKMAKP